MVQSNSIYYISPIEIVLLWAKIPLKSFHGLDFLAPNRYVIDLSNEVLIIDFGQGAAKILEVKVGGRKKYCRLGPAQNRRTQGPAELADVLSTFNFDL